MELSQHDRSTLPLQEGSKKRQRNPAFEDEEKSQSQPRRKDDDGTFMSSPIEEHNNKQNRQRTINMQNITQMKLEAIFHPKFENEKSDQQIRQSMIDKVSNGEGILEVSLKHSGSLLLWSGGKRYYSKNGMDNVYTSVGEVLLRQHFARAWIGSATDSGTDFVGTDFVGTDFVGSTTGSSDIEEKYRECSAYVQSHRLTLSFEVVTSMLGHHGDLPKRDFLILIAVADRNTGTFYSTTQIMEFAQTFRLPHNDAWVFKSRETATKLFEVYDSSRETGLADYIIDSLSQAADSYVKSLYPHEIFQGQILEGFVIRFIRIASSTHSSTNIELQMSIISQLCTQSDKILKAVPPEKVLPNFTSCGTSGSIQLLNTNLRELFNKNDLQRASLKLKEMVHQPIDEHELVRSVINIDKKEIDLPSLSLTLLQNDNIDLETKRICSLIQTIHDLQLSVNYHVRLELNKTLDGTIVSKRYLCIVHILHDACHQKYHYATRSSDNNMALFRGFTFELISEDTIAPVDSLISSTIVQRMSKVMLRSISDVVHNTDDGKLILKMKLLPYMIRTFICRNGLSILEKKGTGAFNQYAFDQLSKWNVSKEAMDNHLSFVHAWGIYCESPSQTNVNGITLPTLSMSNYLHHLYHFQSMYDSGFFNKKLDRKCSFHGLVVVVGVDKEEMKSFAIALSSYLGCTRVVTDVNAITEADIANSMLNDCGGIVCASTITDGCKNLRNLGKNYKDHIFLALIGCSQMEIESAFVKMSNPDRKELKKTIGMTNAWRKSIVAYSVEIPSSCISSDIQFDEDERLSTLVETLKEASAVPDDRPGVIVFFPTIPGCGKSYLCSHISRNSICVEEDRELIVREGDRTVGKFWPIALQDKMKKPSSIFIADKNAPIASWKSIDNICSKTRNISVAVLPSTSALEDTIIECESQSEDGGTVVLKHYYPFSLAFLALCMSRVLQRQPNSHNGKLDAASKEACMIVVKFYCLYRNKSVSSLLNQVSKFGYAKNQIIRVPFFKTGDLPDMPKDLKTSLEKAISLQTQHDLNLKASFDYLVVEQELRCAVTASRVYIESLPADKIESKDSFIDQLKETISDVQLLRDNSEPVSSSNNIQLVSLDFDRNSVNFTLEEISKQQSEFNSFLSLRDFNTAKLISSGDGNWKKDRFINKTHCTFAHSDILSQEEMKQKFDHIIGVSCEISVNAVLFNDNIAALEVAVPLVNDTLTPIPSSMNEFTHITVWCKGGTYFCCIYRSIYSSFVYCFCNLSHKNNNSHLTGIRSMISNELPREVKAGLAKRIELELPIIIKGTFSYWYN